MSPLGNGQMALGSPPPLLQYYRGCEFLASTLPFQVRCRGKRERERGESKQSRNTRKTQFHLSTQTGTCELPCSSAAAASATRTPGASRSTWTAPPRPPWTRRPRTRTLWWSRARAPRCWRGRGASRGTRATSPYSCSSTCCRGSPWGWPPPSLSYSQTGTSPTGSR